MKKTDETEGHYLTDLAALEAAMADVRLSGLEPTDAMKARLYQAVKDQNVTIEELIAEVDEYLD